MNLTDARVAQDNGGDATTDEEGAALDAAAEALAKLEQEVLEKAQDEAEQILSAARDEAEAMLDSANKQIEEERSKAQREGYAKGEEEGKAASDVKYSEIYEAKKREDDDMLKRVIDELYTERKATYDGLEDEVVSLALEIVKKILDPAEEAIGGVFASLIRNALKQMAPEGKVVIRVSHAEYERFFSSGMAYFELDKGVTVTAAVLKDTSLNEYDCVIDTYDETVNAGIDSQLNYIKIAFNRSDEE